MRTTIKQLLIIFFSILIVQFSFSQSIVEKWENGNKKIEGQLVNGERHGPWKMWYETGEIEQEGVYENGPVKGIWTNYYKNGEKRKEADWQNGRLVSWTKFYPNEKPELILTSTEGLADTSYLRIVLMEKEIEESKLRVIQGLEYYIDFLISMENDYILNYKKKNQPVSLMQYLYLENFAEELASFSIEIRLERLDFIKVHAISIVFKHSGTSGEIKSYDYENQLMQHRFFSQGVESKRTFSEYYSGEVNKLYARAFMEKEILKEVRTYLTGDRTSYSTMFYHANGNTESAGKVKSKLQSGKWQYFDEGGKLIREVAYKKGVIKE